MRCAAALTLLLLAACGEKAAYEYPPAAQTAFHRQCPADNPECACVWNEITHAMTAEEYQAAMRRFEAEGLMDPRVTHARVRCKERHG
jgi:predicted small lipoprotein YifL